MNDCCPICREDFEDSGSLLKKAEGQKSGSKYRSVLPYLVLGCQHRIHTSCAIPSLRDKSCPLCRSGVVYKDEQSSVLGKRGLSTNFRCRVACQDDRTIVDFTPLRGNSFQLDALDSFGMSLPSGSMHQRPAYLKKLRLTLTSEVCAQLANRLKDCSEEIKGMKLCGCCRKYGKADRLAECDLCKEWVHRGKCYADHKRLFCEFIRQREGIHSALSDEEDEEFGEEEEDDLEPSLATTSLTVPSTQPNISTPEFPAGL